MLTSLAIVAVLALLIACLRLARARRAADRAAQKLAKDRRRLLQFMHLMAEALGEGLSTDDLRRRIVHAAMVSTGASSGAFFEQTNRGTMRSAAVEGLFPPHRPITDDVKAGLTTRARFVAHILQPEEFPITEGLVGRVARTRRGELIRNAAADDRVVKHDDPALAVKSVIVSPLVFRGRFFGVLAVVNPAGGRQFGPDDFSLVESLAEQAALALHNAAFLHLQMAQRQFEMDLALASSMQRMLLPRDTVRHDSIEINARYLPAQQVSGDLYDVLPLSPTRLGVVVADVSGKGIAASLLMAICRTNLRQIAPRHSSPAEALRELNRLIDPEMTAGLYITVLYAIIDTAKGDLTFARAGHELPLLGRREPGAPGPSLHFLHSDGMAVGMVPEGIFDEAIADQTERFGAGDVLVLYTDGLTEAANDDGKEFSGARLVDAVRSVFSEPPHALNDALLHAVQRFTGGKPLGDDLTLVTVRRL